MALFKILKGTKANLPATKTEGQMYITTDDPGIYVDTNSSTRIQVANTGASFNATIINDTAKATTQQGDNNKIELEVTANGPQFSITKNNQSVIQALQPKLTSGTNIKTINRTSLLGSGSIKALSGTFNRQGQSVTLQQFGDTTVETIELIRTDDGVYVQAVDNVGTVLNADLVDKTYVSKYQTQAQVEALILDELSRFDKLDYEIVTTLPAAGTAGVRYLVKHPTDDRYEEYIYVNGAWYDIGATDEVNLDDYYTKTETDLLLDDKADVADIPTSTSQLTNDGDGTNAFVTSGDAATDSDYGVVKTNSASSITLNASGQLEVGGRLGQFPGTTGIYAASDRDPRAVGDSSFLITDAKGVELDTSRAFALVSGLGVACKSAAAGTTEYHFNNTYANRILCKIAENGYAARDEPASKAERVIPVVSVTINGAAYTPSSAANDTANDIIIKTETSLNPDSAITNVRLFPTMKSYSTAHIGNGIASWGGGRNMLLGGGITKDGNSNDDIVVGNGTYCSGNGNAVFGRYHIIRKNRGFIAGTGHDTTNASGEGVSAIGVYSYIDANTMFAIGNGTSQTARLNLFEVLKDGSIVLRSPNGTRYKIAVADDGTLTTTAV